MWFWKQERRQAWKKGGESCLQRGCTFLCCFENCPAPGMLLAVVLLHRAECSGAVCGQKPAVLWGWAAAVGLGCSPSQAVLQLQSVIQWELHWQDEVGEFASLFVVALQLHFSLWCSFTALDFRTCCSGKSNGGHSPCRQRRS